MLWNPAFFGSKPDMIIKGGMIVASKMGDANASIPTTQPVCYQPMFAAHGKAKQEACLTFVSQAAFDAGIKDAYGLEKTVVPVHGCRSISKKDMVWNDRTPVLTVDPETYKVTERRGDHFQASRKTAADPALQPVLNGSAFCKTIRGEFYYA